MAKQAKNQMKVKTGIKTYVCTWTFKTPIEEWDRETLVANIRAGLRYAIGRKITTTVLSDEQNVTSSRNKNAYEFMMKLGDGSVEHMARVNQFCKENDIKMEVQTEYVFCEDDFRVVVEEDEPEE